MEIQLFRNLKKKLRRREIWSIGLYKLSGNFDFNFLCDQEPVHLISDATNVYSKSFRSIIADPFLVEFEGVIYIFFEAKSDYQHGKIYCCSVDPKDPSVLFDHGVVLEEDFHLSFPNVIKYNGVIYMLPEAAASGSVLLYRANNFPNSWDVFKELISEPLVDVIMFMNENIFHLIGTDRANFLRHFTSDSFWGPYNEAPKYLSNDPRVNRNGGPLLNFNGGIIRVAQCGDKFYGEKLIFNKIKLIDNENFVEEEMEVKLAEVTPSFMMHGYHHLSTVSYGGHTWVAIDGFRKGSYFNLALFIFFKLLSLGSKFLTLSLRRLRH